MASYYTNKEILRTEPNDQSEFQSCKYLYGKAYTVVRSGRSAYVQYRKLRSIENIYAFRVCALDIL